MKLNYRDKVILAIFLALAILVGGFIGLIKPKNDDIKARKKVLSSKQTSEKEVTKKIDQIGPLQDTIKEIVIDTNKITAKFVPKNKVDSTVKLDEYMQDYANENKIRITDLAVGDMTEENLNYYYIAVGDVGSGLREIADFTGEYQAQLDKEQAEQNQLSEREASAVLKTSYAMTAYGKKEDIWKFLDAIENDKYTIIVDEITYTRKEDEDKLDGPASDEKLQEIKPEDEAVVTMTISLYSLYDLKTPKYEDAE